VPAAQRLLTPDAASLTAMLEEGHAVRWVKLYQLLESSRMIASTPYAVRKARMKC